MSFTVPYHLDPLDYEKKAVGPFTARELKYGAIGIVLAAAVGGALWLAPLDMPELFRVAPAIVVAFPFLYIANIQAPPGYASPEEYMSERLSSALSGEDVYVYGCDDEDEYEVMAEPPAKSPKERKEAAKHEKAEREYARGKARSAR
jgi:hypothetical protein